MELLEAHFHMLDYHLTYEFESELFVMFSDKIGVKKHINYLTFKKLFEKMNNIKNPYILESGIASAERHVCFR